MKSEQVSIVVESEIEISVFLFVHSSCSLALEVVLKVALKAVLELWLGTLLLKDSLQLSNASIFPCLN